MSFKFCPECGYKFDRDYKFCPECGYKLTDAAKKTDDKKLPDIKAEEREKVNRTEELEEQASVEEILDEAEKLYYDKQQDLIMPTVKKYAEEGYAKAQWLLGMCYDGSGVDTPFEDPEKAVYWYKKAVEKGDTSAMISLGQCYNYGYGVEEDLKKARELYNRAKDSGDPTADIFIDLMDTFDE